MRKRLLVFLAAVLVVAFVCGACGGDSAGPAEPFVQDSDRDGVADAVDNCDFHANSDQADRDGDGWGDECDKCPNDPRHHLDGDICDR